MCSLPDGHKDPAYLKRLVKDQNVTTINFVPSMLEEFLEEASDFVPDSLRRVVCAGEELSAKLRDRWQGMFQVGLFNMYGPTRGVSYMVGV